MVNKSNTLAYSESFLSGQEEISASDPSVKLSSTDKLTPLDTYGTATYGSVKEEVSDPVYSDFVAMQTKTTHFRRLPKNSANTEVYLGSMKTISRWECVILDIDEEEFTAKIVKIFPENMLNNAEYEDHADFDLSDVSPSDQECVKQGAVFYWNVGKAKSKVGTVEHKSILVFPRLPAWSEAVESEAILESKEAVELLDWDTTI